MNRKSTKYEISTEHQLRAIFASMIYYFHLSTYRDKIDDLTGGILEKMAGEKMSCSIFIPSKFAIYIEESKNIFVSIYKREDLQ